jgi:hypothetical protein
LENEYKVIEGLKSRLKVGFVILFLGLIFSCQHDDECHDIDYGRQYMSDSTRTSFAYTGGETLVFKDSTGQELTFL